MRVDIYGTRAGTPWAIRSMLAKEEETGGLRFDAVVIDEASQVTLVEASMPLMYLTPTARIIMAGMCSRLAHALFSASLMSVHR